MSYVDKISLERIQLLHPKLREEVQLIFAEICAALTGKSACRFSYTLRTFKEQADLYAQGRTKPGKKVTNANQGQSYHNYGLAVDIVLLLDRDGDGKYTEVSRDTITDFDFDRLADWGECVKVFKKYGWEWGGDFKTLIDKPHFQKTLGYTTKSLLEKYNKKDFIPGTTYLHL